jgi:hypothetical protein
MKITSTEQYVAGLKEAGHEVNFMTVGFRRSGTRRDRSPRGKFADDFVTGPGTGVLMHPTQGWRGEMRLSLMNEDERKAFIDLGKKHDIIIWASVYGFNNPDTAGRSDWFEAITKLKGKHVFFIHDDHLPERYRWAYALAPYARCFIGVQPCSYDSLEAMAAPRAMVYTPLPPLPRQIRSVEEREGFLNCQVWKGWKNGHRLVSAAPHMPRGSVSFAGDGIQLRYLRSPDKCPPKWAGWWDAAMKKQTYLGVLQEKERDQWLAGHKFLVDLSLRSNSGQINRITQEAMAQGCVVIADPRFISGHSGATPFKAGRDYVAIDATLEGKALAEELQHIDRKIDATLYTQIQKNARKALAVFDRKALGQRIVDVARLAEGRELPSADPRVAMGVKAAKNMFMEVFS